jgi:hypothetical protein
MNLGDLLGALPLSAYTPGQGDPSMEGGWATASGAPMYPIEWYLSGKAPYVTGATGDKKMIGQWVNRTVGDQVVPVQLTDYGPGVKGIDIATTNRKWATNFPYQGQTETGSIASYNNMKSAPSPAIPGGSNPAQTGTWGDYAKALTTPTAGEKIGSAIAQVGNKMAQQGQQGTQQALAMLQRPNPFAAYLRQLLNPDGAGI